jgi:hypothetical protein
VVRPELVLAVGTLILEPLLVSSHGIKISRHFCSQVRGVALAGGVGDVTAGEIGVMDIVVRGANAGTETGSVDGETISSAGEESMGELRYCSPLSSRDEVGLKS